MPPKPFQKTSQGSSQESALQRKFKKFCQELAKAKKKGGIIKNIESTNIIKEATRSIRSNRNKNQGIQNIEDTIIVDILEQLEEVDNDICSRIDPSIFSCILATVLLATPSRECQRIVYLLGRSLHRDSNSSEDVITSLPLRKAEIGKECILHLLEYYISEDYPATLRRWVGILCIHLHLGCQANHHKIELAGEDSRRSIGHLIFADPDELLRLISGQLVRNLYLAGTPLIDLFPTDYDKHMHHDFPTSTPTDVSWFKGFQDYLDALSERQNSQSFSTRPASAGSLYYATFLTLAPGPKFGVDNDNVYIFIDFSQKEINIMSVAKGKMFDQILQILPTAVQQMTITTNTQSQKGLAIIDINLLDTDDSGFLDGRDVKLEMVSMRIMLADTNTIKQELSELCPGLEIHDSTQIEEATSSQGRSWSQVTHTSTVEIMVHTEPYSTQVSVQPNPLGQQVSQERKIPKSPFKILAKGLKSVVNASSLEEHEFNSEEESNVMSANGNQGSSLLQNKASPKPKVLQHKGVKSKAKKPLVTTRRSLDGQMRQISSVNENGSHSQSSTQLKKLHTISSQDDYQTPSIQASRALSKVKQNTQALPFKIVDEYDIPVDEDNGDERTKPVNKAKKKAVVAKSKNAAKANATKQKTDKRKSAPAILGSQGDSQTRRSQRAAASKASEKFYGQDNSDDEEEVIAELTAEKVSKQPPLNRKIANGLMGPPALPKPLEITIDEREKRSQLLLQDESIQARNSPSIDTNHDRGDEDDLYSASPLRKKSLQTQSKAQVQTLVSKNQNALHQEAIVAVNLGVEEARSQHAEDIIIVSSQLAVGKATSTNFDEKLAGGLNKLFSDFGAIDKSELSLNSEKDGEEITGHKHEKDAAQIVQVIHQGQKHSTQATTIIAVQTLEPQRIEVINEYEMPDFIENHQSPAGSSQVVVESFQAHQSVNAEPENETQGIQTHQSPRGDFQIDKDGIHSHQLVETGDGTNQQDIQKPVSLNNRPQTDGKAVHSHQSSEAIPQTAMNDTQAYYPSENEPSINAVSLSRSLSPAVLRTTSAINSSIEPKSDIHKTKPATTPTETTNKRKADYAIDLPPKKRKSNDKTQTLDFSGSLETLMNVKLGDATTPIVNRRTKETNTPPTRKSARLASRATNEKARADKIQNKNSSMEVPLLGRSPRPAEKGNKPLDKMMTNNMLANEKLTRKPQLISFGLNGARNQGPSDVTQNQEKRIEKAKLLKPNADLEMSELPEKKRKRIISQVNDESQPKKRQHSSPTLEDHGNDGGISDEGEVTIVKSSPPDLTRTAPFLRRKLFTQTSMQVPKVDTNQGTPASLGTTLSLRPQLLTRPSSQSSKVDSNGSPIAPESRRRDHIGKLKTSLTKGSQSTNDDGFDNSPTRSVDVFGPRIALTGNVPKAGPSSPDAVVSRYVAHETMDSGHYREVLTTEVIALEQALPDPFTGQEQRSSSFMEILEKVVVAPKFMSKREVTKFASPQHLARSPQNVTAASEPPQMEKIPEVKIFTENSISSIPVPQFVPRQRTAKQVSPKQGRGDRRLPMNRPSALESDRRSGSPGRTQKNQAREPMKESANASNVWNMAIRPHYASLHSAVHKIADELIIRLSDEEDRMKLIADQYQQNGSKIVEKFTEERGMQRHEVLSNVDKKKAKVINAYEDAKRLMGETITDKQNSISVFEKEWTSQQQQIRKKIAQGRKVSD